jgi:photosystem II stability/assembly factor-like uncharacterized protein
MNFKSMFIFVVCMAVLIVSGCSKEAWKRVVKAEMDSANKKYYFGGFNNENHGILIGYGGIVAYTNDMGKTWKAGSNVSWCRFGLEIVDDNFAISTGNKGHNRITKDGGMTWQPVSDFGSMEPNQIRYASFIDEKNGWIASPEVLAMTDDGGIKWTAISLPEGIGKILSIDYRNFGGYLLDNNGSVFVTKDNGKSWEKFNININVNDFQMNAGMAQTSAIRFTGLMDASIVLFQIKPDKCLVSLTTKDGGKTWIKNEIKEKLSVSNTVYMSRDAKYITVKEVKNGKQVLTVFKSI